MAMFTASISMLQAACGRFLCTSDLFAWEASSQRRCTELVRAFQRKDLDPDGLAAALTSERLGASPAAPSSSAIAVIGLTGVLMPTPSIFSFLGFGTSTREFTQQLTAAAFDPKVKAIAIVVDSPGGSIRLIPEAAAAMRQARKRKPVVVTVAGMAASAGYWIASNATAIESTASGSVGAIGILTERVSRTKQLARDGVDVTIVSAGKYKGEGHEATPITDAEQQALQRRVDAAYAQFVSDVAAGRHVTAAAVRDGFGEGRVIEAADGLRLGMIDRIAVVEDTLARTIAAPAALTALLTQRADHLRTRTERARRDQARAEIATHRARLQAAAHRSAMR
jgi:signal peptide peptidase SppA